MTRATKHPRGARNSDTAWIPTGFETVDATSNLAEDYANRQTEALQNPVQFDPDLQIVIKAWDSLPQVVRHDIVALVRAVQINR